jgi:hypothetical protein
MPGKSHRQAAKDNSGQRSSATKQNPRRLGIYLARGLRFEKGAVAVHQQTVVGQNRYGLKST